MNEETRSQKIEYRMGTLDALNGFDASETGDFYLLGYAQGIWQRLTEHDVSDVRTVADLHARMAL